jgi:hypothetical protein
MAMAPRPFKGSSKTKAEARGYKIGNPNIKIVKKRRVRDASMFLYFGASL